MPSGTLVTNYIPSSRIYEKIQRMFVNVQSSLEKALLEELNLEKGLVTSLEVHR